MPVALSRCTGSSGKYSTDECGLQVATGKHPIPCARGIAPIWSEGTLHPPPMIGRTPRYPAGSRGKGPDVHTRLSPSENVDGGKGFIWDIKSKLRSTCTRTRSASFFRARMHGIFSRANRLWCFTSIATLRGTPTVFRLELTRSVTPTAISLTKLVSGMFHRTPAFHEAVGYFGPVPPRTIVFSRSYVRNVRKVNFAAPSFVGILHLGGE
eukprot:1189300-Prorocentrum_minimum.AAC.2